jgi:hypothetical protein
MGVNIAEPRQTYIQSSAEPELKSVVVVVWTREKREGRRGDRKEEQLEPHLLGGLQTIEKEEECSYVEKMEGSGRSKSRTPIETGGGNRKNRNDSRRPSHEPQKGTELDLDAISECLRTRN